MSKTVLFTDDEAAHLVTVTGWVSRDGRFFGKDERTARYAGCTHMVCECGEPFVKGFIHCPACREKREAERFAKLERKPWDGETPMVLFGTDTYFFSWDDVEEYAEDHEVAISSLRLILCEPVGLPQFDTSDLLCDYLGEDQEAPEDVDAAVQALNAVLRARGHFCWTEGKVAVDMGAIGGTDE